MADPIGPIARDDAHPALVDTVRELLLVAAAIVAIHASVLFVGTAFVVERSLHDLAHGAAATTRADLAGGGAQPTITPGVTAPDDQETETGRCDNFDPNTATFGEAIGCMITAVAGGIGAGLKLGLYILFVCYIIPIVSIILAALLYYLATQLEKHSRQCGKKKRWWQRLWCWIKRILYYVLVALAILLVIVAIVSLVLCLIAIL